MLLIKAPDEARIFLEFWVGVWSFVFIGLRLSIPRVSSVSPTDKLFCISMTLGS